MEETWRFAAGCVAGKVRDAEKSISVGVASELSQSKHSTQAPVAIAHVGQRMHKKEINGY